MITLLTPSKTMDFADDTPGYVVTRSPHFSDEAARIRTLLRSYDVADIMTLMRVSRPLAERVVAQYAATDMSKAALWAYRGDVFKGLQAWTLSAKAAVFADSHLLIPSAVYGLLRPYDVIEPYRLEMNIRLGVTGLESLHDYWGGRIARYVMQHEHLYGELCVLSSEEYSKALLASLPSEISVIIPTFIDRKRSGQEAQVPIYNKMMRGVMGRWIVDHQIDSAADLVAFTAHGYTYSHERSQSGRPVFFRPAMEPLKLN